MRFIINNSSVCGVNKLTLKLHCLKCVSKIPGRFIHLFHILSLGVGLPSLSTFGWEMFWRDFNQNSGPQDLFSTSRGLCFINTEP